MKIVFLLGWILPLVGCHPPGGAADDSGVEVSLKETAAPRRFLALGDSYTIGQSVSKSERWPEQLVVRLAHEGVRFEAEAPAVVARTGWTTDELSRAMDAQSVAGVYDMVSLLIGVNNQYRGRPLLEFRRGFRELLRRAVEHAGGDPARVLVLSIPDWGATPFAQSADRARVAAEIDAFNAVVREESRRLGARFVDVTAISRRGLEAPSLIAPDGLHPSGKMYAAFVEAMMPQVREILGRAPL